MKKRIRMKLLKGKTVTCEFCDGHGQYEDSHDDMFGNNHSLGLVSCQCCNGEGHVDALKEFKTNVKVGKMVKNLRKELWR